MNEPVDTEKAKEKHSAYSKQHSTPLITTIANRNQKTPSTNKRGAKSRLAELCETSPSLSKLNKSNMKQTKLDAFVKKKDSTETPTKLDEANTKEKFFDTENDRPSPISSKYDSARSSRSSSPISFTAPLSPKKRNSVEDEDEDEDEEDSNKPKLDCLNISALNNNTITNKNDQVSFVQPKTPPAQPSQPRDESFNVSISSTKAEISQTSIVDDLNETISAYNDNEETVKENNERQARLIEAELIINGSGTPTKTLTKRKSKKDELLKLSKEKTELREEYDSSSSLISATRNEEQHIVKPVNAVMSMPIEQVNIKQVNSQCPKAESKPTANFEAPPTVQPTSSVLAPTPQTTYNSMEQANLMTPCAYPPVQTPQQPITGYNSYYPDQNGLQIQQQQSAYHPNQPVYYANQPADPQYYPYMQQQQQQPTNYQQMQPGYYPPNNQNYMYPTQMQNQQIYQAGYSQQPQQQQPPPYYNYNYYSMPAQYKQPDVTQTPPPPTRPLSEPGSMPLPAEKQLPQQSQYASLTPLQPMSQMPAQPAYYQQTQVQYNQMQPGAQAAQQYPINPNYYGSTGYYYPPQTSQ